MAEPKKDDTPSESTIKGDVQKKADKEQAQGYVGVVTDPIPNEEYSLESGPDSPHVVPDDRTQVTQHLSRDAKEASK